MAVVKEPAKVPRQEEDHLLDTLDEALRTQLIRAGNGETFIFTHDKIREVLIEELNPIRRRRLHQRIGEDLEKLYQGQAVEAHVQDLAYHYLHSGDLEKALDYALRAARAAERLYAYEEATSYYQQAAECADALGESDQLADISVAVGNTLVMHGVVYEAAEAYQRALELTASPEARAALKTKIGNAYGVVGDERGMAYLESARDELDPATQADELAHTLTVLGRYHHYHSQHSQAIACYESARKLAEPLENAPTLSYLYSYLAGEYQHLARFDKSMEWANQCLALGERKNYPPAMGFGYEFLAEDLILTGRWNEALEYARLDREIGERIGSLDRVAWAGYCQTSALYGLGNLEEARDVAGSGLALAERIGDGRLITWLEGQLGFIETDLGEIEAAGSHTELALTRANELGQVILQCWSLSALAYLHVRQREWDLALECCQQGIDLYAPTENRVAPLFLGALAAEAQLGAGRLDEAVQGIATYLSLAGDTDSLQSEAVALRVQGQILKFQQRWDKAGRSFNSPRHQRKRASICSRVPLRR